MKSRKLTMAELKRSDCVVIVTDHSCFDYDWIVDNAKLIVDTRNVVKRKSNNVVKL